MGNTSGLPSHSSDYNNQNERKSVKALTEEADQFSISRNLDAYNSSIVKRIYVQTRQTHLIQVLKTIKQKQRIQQFLDQVHTANIQILDSFYEHILRSTQSLGGCQQRQFQNQQQFNSPFDRQIGICGSTNIMKDRQWEPISEKYVEIVNLAKGVHEIAQYEKYKQIGLQAIKKQEICFIILSGGRNLRYDLNKNKQCDLFEELPSKICLIQLLLKKLQALGKLIDSVIHIYIMVNDDERKKAIRKIKSAKLSSSQYIQVDFLTQLSYGCLDEKGKLILTDNFNVYLHPNGSGDIWGNFQNKNFIESGLNKFKYTQIFGVSNILQHCFDCFMIGKLINQQIPWITMACLNEEGYDGLDPVIFVNKQKQIQVRDPQQIGCGMDHDGLLQFPTKCPHIFLNNTVFSIDFIVKAVNSPQWLQFRKYHCKRKLIDHRKPLSKHSTIYTFQRQLSGIFAITISIYKQNNVTIKNPKNIMSLTCGASQLNSSNLPKSKRGSVVLMNGQEYNSPFYTYNDRIIGAVSLSQINKRWLKLTKRKNDISFKSSRSQQKDKDYYEEKLKQICDIDPYVSIEGENLQQIIEQLASTKGKVQYPLYIGAEQFDQHSQTNNTNNSLKQSKFQKLNSQ